MGHRWTRARRVMGSACVVALTGCGSAVVGGPGDATGSTPGAEDRPPTTLPFVRDAPREFTERAEHIAETLRASGALDRYVHSPVITSDHITWPDSRDPGELKAVLGNGGYEAGPSVPDVPGMGTVRFADGRTMQVDVMGARSTLDATKEGRPGCVGVGDESCPLVFTAARLGTMRVSTNQGPAEVPAWEFSAKELTSPQIVVAVDPNDLPGLPAPVYDSASWPHTLFGAGWLLSVKDSSVTVEMDFGSCSREWSAHVYEASDIVVVGGSDKPIDLPPGVGCGGVGYLAPATVVLDKPLGARPVVDIAWGKVLTPRPQPEGPVSAPS